MNLFDKSSNAARGRGVGSGFVSGKSLQNQVFLRSFSIVLSYLRNLTYLLQNTLKISRHLVDNSLSNSKLVTAVPNVLNFVVKLALVLSHRMMS